jgi:hypothetical protein
MYQVVSPREAGTVEKASHLVIHPAQVGLAETQYIKVAWTPTVFMHTHSEKGPISLKD